MVAKIKDRYKPTKNTTLSNYEFHKIVQRDNETFDAFINRVKHEAHGCNFKCKNAECDVQDTLVRDQVLIGTNNKEILKNALKEQWSLSDLGVKGRQMEATSHGASRISAKEDVEVGVNRIAGITPNRISTEREKRYREKLQLTILSRRKEMLWTRQDLLLLRKEESIIVEGRRKRRQNLAEMFIGWRKVTDCQTQMIMIHPRKRARARRQPVMKNQ